MKKKPKILRGVLLTAGFLLLCSCSSSPSSSKSPSSRVTSQASSSGEDAVVYDKSKNYVTAKLEDLTLDYFEADSYHPEEGYYVGDYKGSAKNLVIPDTIEIKGKSAPIVGISDYAFAERKYPETLVIGENVHTIGNNAFYSSPVKYLYGTRNLVHFDITATNFAVKTSSYGGVSYIPSKDNPYCVAVGATAYTNHTLHSQTETLSDGMKYWDFSYQPSLKVIGKRSKPLSVPDGIGELSLLYASDNAFSGVASLTNLIFEEGAFGIGNKAFYNCKGLTSVSIPGSVTKIGNSAFYSCSSLGFVSFGEGLKEIGSDAFAACKKLTSLVLPTSLNSIGDRAFQNCKLISKAIIKSTDVDFGEKAFSGCPERVLVI